MIFILYLYSDLKIKNEIIIKNFALAIIFILSIYYISIYGYIRNVFNEREQYILEQIKNDKIQNIVVPKVPFDDYVWNADFDSDYDAGLYKGYLGIKKDITFTFVDYEEWKEIKE